MNKESVDKYNCMTRLYEQFSSSQAGRFYFQHYVYFNIYENKKNC
jgi:hypothetical protein